MTLRIGMVPGECQRIPDGKKLEIKEWLIEDCDNPAHLEWKPTPSSFEITFPVTEVESNQCFVNESAIDLTGCIEAIIAQNALNGERPSTMVLPLESIRLFGTVAQRLKLAEHWESSRRSKRRNRQLLRRLKKGQSLDFLGNLRVDLF